MADFTYTAFAAALASITVAGVTTYEDEPPNIETNTNFPIMYPRLPTVDREILTLGYKVGLKTASCDLVILVAHDSLGTPAVKFSTAIALLDALDAALESNTSSVGIDRWTITPEITDYQWALVASVEGSG